MIYIASSTSGKGKYGRPASIARPPKLDPGDILIAAIGYTTGESFVEPRDVWTTEESIEHEGMGLSVYGKVVEEDEPDTYNWYGLPGIWTGMVFRIKGGKPGEVFRSLAMDGGESRLLWSPSLEIEKTAFVMAGVLAEGSLYSSIPQKGLRAPHVSRIGRQEDGLTMSASTTDKAGGGLTGPWYWRLPEVTKHIGWSIAFTPDETDHLKTTPIKEKRIGIRRK